MMCGCAVVATDIGGHREYIEDGVNGFLCKPFSVESIVEKVEHILHNPEKARKVSEYAPQTLKKFDWDSRVDLFEQAILSSPISSLK
jgi:glycosyltransferase involved in cell wall biosynthesis